MVAAWLVHLYTASGVVFGFLAATSIYQHAYRGALLWLFAATVVDATDGILARRADVRARLPGFDGALLDNLVDYVTYVFVPALFVWQALLVPVPAIVPVCAAMLLSSAYGFSQAAAKTGDHFFTGFPSYWNVVVLYLFVAGWPPAVNAAVVLTLAALVFVPVRYVYPSRTPVLRRTTNVMGAAWAAAVLVLVIQAPAESRILFWGSLVFPVYYLALSWTLHLRRGAERAEAR